MRWGNPWPVKNPSDPLKVTPTRGSPPAGPAGPVAGAEARYGVLTTGTAHAIVLSAAIRRYTRSPAQETPGSQSKGASPQVASSRPPKMGAR